MIIKLHSIIFHDLSCLFMNKDHKIRVNFVLRNGISPSKIIIHNLHQMSITLFTYLLILA